jgi:hypothetical protein
MFMMQVFYNSTILVVQKWKGDGDVAQKNIGFTRGTHCITVFEIQRPIKHTRVDLFHYMYIGHNGISNNIGFGCDLRMHWWKFRYFLNI